MADPYLDARADVISKAYDAHAQAFLAAYNPALPTVLLLPGGMGSQLDRSPAPFNPPQELPLGQFDPVWIDFGLLFGQEARGLEITPAGHDKDDHVVVPNGPLRFLAMNKPYDLTQRFFADEGFNFAVFGFDWRRPVTECAQYLEVFLDKVRTRVGARHPGHTLADITLLAHSQGGLVAALYLQNLFGAGATPAEVRASGIGRVITAGTPFYTTSHNIFRYFRGQSPLNTLYGTRDVARISGSLPGPYILNYPDRALIAAEGGLGLSRYPVRDGADPESLEADPFDPAIQATRYPAWMSPGAMAAALRIKRKICRPLPAAARDILWHIRSGLDTKTPVEVIWNPPRGAAYDFDADGFPFEEVAGEGDGVVPAWAAALAQTPEDQVYDCKVAGEHETLLEHPEPLKAALRVIRTGSFPKKMTVPADAGEPERASPARVRRLFDDIAAGTATRDDPRLADRAVWRRIIEEAHLC